MLSRTEYDLFESLDVVDAHTVYKTNGSTRVNSALARLPAAVRYYFSGRISTVNSTAAVKTKKNVLHRFHQLFDRNEETNGILSIGFKARVNNSKTKNGLSVVSCSRRSIVKVTKADVIKRGAFDGKNHRTAQRRGRSFTRSHQLTTYANVNVAKQYKRYCT